MVFMVFIAVFTAVFIVVFTVFIAVFTVFIAVFIALLIKSSTSCVYQLEDFGYENQRFL